SPQRPLRFGPWRHLWAGKTRPKGPTLPFQKSTDSCRSPSGEIVIAAPQRPDLVRSRSQPFERTMKPCLQVCNVSTVPGACDGGGNGREDRRRFSACPGGSPC